MNVWLTNVFVEQHGLHQVCLKKILLSSGWHTSQHFFIIIAIGVTSPQKLTDIADNVSTIQKPFVLKVVVKFIS